jgi:hypothetical protein
MDTAQFRFPTGIVVTVIPKHGRRLMSHLRAHGTLVDSQCKNLVGARTVLMCKCCSQSDGLTAYVADTGNNAIRKVVIATGEVLKVTCT